MNDIQQMLRALPPVLGLPYVDQATLERPPLAPASVIFVTSAIAHVGRVTDPEWNGAERSALYYPSPAVASTMTVAQILAKHSPPRRQVPMSLASANPGPPLENAAAFAKRLERWEADAPKRLRDAEKQVEDASNYYEAWKAGIEDHRKAVDALHDAARKLCAAVINGQVTPYYRPHGGGDVQKMAPGLWADESLPARISRGGIFFTKDASSYYLFVDREELMNAFPTSEGMSDTLSGRELSPYLQLMAFVVRTLDIKPDQRVKGEAIKSQIEASAAQFGLTVGVGGHLPPRDVVTMAKFLQPPR